MRRIITLAVIAGVFIVVSALLYYFHYLVFRDTHHILIFLVGDLAFLPLEVFLVVIVIERILARREKQAMMQKLNMVIGAFLSEVGSHLLLGFVECLQKCETDYSELVIENNWTHNDFLKAMSFADSLVERPDYSNINLEELRAFLVEKRHFLLRLLENPNILEHDRFTDLLWATFHLTEELEARQSLQDIPESDFEHIANDIKRVYDFLIVEWLYYTEHLKLNYPFLFSLVVRTNPFKEHASATVTE